MNNFGLGLILSFTDNATSGIQNATGAFNALNSSVTAFSNANSVDTALLQVATSAGIVGDELYRVGEGITSMFTGVISSVNNVGTTILTARNQLGTLYGDMVAGQQVLNQIKDYAAKSIFNFEDLIPIVVMLKANGIEAFDQIASSAYRATNGVEGVSQTLMDYAADLAAFNPQMHNIYGTGIMAAMGSLNEYISEGNYTSLRRNASLDILQILGEEKGKTIEERSRQVADLIEKLGMVGMTANLAGTPMQRMSNAGDLLFNMMSQISDSGVFDRYTDLIAKFTDYLFNIPEDEIENIAQIIADSLVEIMNPLEKVLDMGIQVADWLRDLLKQNPEIVKAIIKGTALAGVFLLISGASLTLFSALGKLKFSLSMLFGNNILTSGMKILSLFRNLTLFVLPVIAAVTLLKTMWDRDFMGMQETLRSFVQDTIETFRLLFDAWQDYTLSEDNFEKAKELGILPLIEAVLQLKYHLGFLADGFKRGFEAFFIQLEDVLVKFGILDKDTGNVRDAITQLLEKITAPGLTDNWERFGYILGEVAGWALVIISLLPTVIKIANVLFVAIGFVLRIYSFFSTWLPVITQTLSTWLPTITGFFSTLWTWLSSAVTWILSGIGNITIAILGLFGITVSLPAWLVGLIVVALVAIAALIWHFRDEIADFLKKVWEDCLNLFMSIFNWWKETKIGQFVINLVSRIMGVISQIIEDVTPVITRVITYIQHVINGVIPIVLFIWGILSSFYQSVWKIITSIFSFFSKVSWNVMEIASTLFIHIFKIVLKVYNVIFSVISGAWKIIKSVAGLIKNIAYAGYELIRVVVLAIGAIFSWLYDNIVTPVINAIAKAFEWLCTNVFEPVGDFISKVFNKIADIVRWLKDEVFVPVFNGIKDFMCDAIQKAYDFISPILDTISEGISWVADKLSAIIDNASSFFGNIGGSLENVGDGISEMVGLSTGGYVKTTGIAVLHPNEVVVNDTLTQGLASFLADYKKSSPLVTQDIVAVDDEYEERDEVTPDVPTPDNDPYDSDNSPVQSYVNNTYNNSDTDNSNGDTTVDNSITFSQGSIVFNIDKDTDLANMSTEELDAVAEKLMKIMARKMQLRGMQTRK